MNDKQRLLAFLNGWRARLLTTPAHDLQPEQFGQLVTLNTIIAWVQDEIPDPPPTPEAVGHLDLCASWLGRACDCTPPTPEDR